MKSEEIWDALYEQRILVLMECEDGKFRQVLLDKEQLKKVTADICVSRKDDPELRPGFEMVEIKLNTDWEIDPAPFDGLSSTAKEV